MAGYLQVIYFQIWVAIALLFFYFGAGNGNFTYFVSGVLFSILAVDSAIKMRKSAKEEER